MNTHTNQFCFMEPLKKKQEQVQTTIVSKRYIMMDSTINGITDSQIQQQDDPQQILNQKQ